MLRGHVRDEPREFLLPGGGDRRAPRLRRGSRCLRSRWCARLPSAHPTGHTALKQKGQTEGIGFKQVAVLEEVPAERLVTLRPETRCGVRPSHVEVGRPLFALDFKAFSIVRGCTLTRKR